MTAGDLPRRADESDAETVESPIGAAPAARTPAASSPDAASQPWRLLGSCRALSSLSPSALRDLFDAATERSFAPAEAMIRQGDHAEGLWIVLEGAARAMRHDPDGAVHCVGHFRSGDIVGEMALVTRAPRTATVLADSPVRALLVPAAAFERLAARHLELGVVLTELVAERLGRGANDGFGGKQVEGYRIQRCVGRGGMSVVYCASEDATGELVALKMMSYRLIYDPAALARFHQEAEVVRGLHHANIARLMRLFPALNTFFLVMELCDGVDLAHLIRWKGRFTEGEVRPILGQLAQALDYVHGRGFVHRDLKPGNVMITRDGLVKLTDFGIAVPEVILDDRTATGRHPILGTPAYMAPEQLAGGPLDRRTDLYALACLAYNLLTGQHLFASSSILELAQQKLTLQLPSREAIGGGVSEDMHAFLRAALRVDPNERPASAGVLAAWAGPCAPPPAHLFNEQVRP